VQEKLEFAAQAPDVARVFFGETVELDHGDEEAKQVLSLETSTKVIRALLARASAFEDWDQDTVRQVMKDIGNELGVKGKALFMTVRVAVSGQSHGPDLNALLALIGPAVTAKRLADTLSKL